MLNEFWGQRSLGIEYRRQGLHVETDRAKGVTKFMGGSMGDQHDRFVLMAELVLGQHLLVLLYDGANVGAGDVAVVHDDKIRPVDRRIEVNLFDSPAGDWSADSAAVQDARD